MSAKNTLIKGTILLTVSGFATRIMGFFYRIYLSNALGPEDLGIYQLIFPVYGICFTLFAAGYQTASSKMIASTLMYDCGGKPNARGRKILRTTLIYSVLTALVLSFAVFFGSDFIAAHFLLEPRSAGALRILSLLFPFAAVTAATNGYYYGRKKAGIPATTQFLEQVARILAIFLLLHFLRGKSGAFTCEMAVFGMLIGEMASMLFNAVSLFFRSEKCPHEQGSRSKQQIPVSKELMKLTLPITGNRLVISILHSLEAIMIPTLFRASGMASSDALSIYGTLNGMSMPFIMFPSTVTNSLSVMLLPAISEAEARKSVQDTCKTASLSIKYSILIGMISLAVFLLFGSALGEMVFHSSLAGTYLMTLAWLCPFLYVTTTLGSILTGLGKAHLSFFSTVTGYGLRILMLLYLVPKSGISGYFISLLVSQLVIVFIEGAFLFHFVPLKFDAVNWLVKPGFILLACGYPCSLLYSRLATLGIANLPILLGFCGFLCVAYLILLAAFKVFSPAELK